MTQVVIIAGGRGTRLRARIGDLPKALAPVAGRPLIGRQLDVVARHGWRDVLILTGHGAEAIERFCQDGSAWGLDVRYRRETEPLGTAGALFQAVPELAERLVVLYGDTLLDVDLARMVAAHAHVGADATLLIHPNDHPADSDLVETDETGWIRAFHAYPHPAGLWRHNLVNAAAYVMERRTLSSGSGDIAKDLFPEWLARGARLWAYRTAEYIRDAGTPERLDQAEADWAAGRVGPPPPAGWPAVFLDRDGTLTRDTGLVCRPEQLTLFDDTAQAVRALNQSGRLAVVATNQPVIARGDCDEPQLAIIHAKLETLLGQEHAYLDGIYHCPHHPDGGYAGERPELKIACDCRKPRPGLLLRAAAELRIDLRRSWMVGDSTVDLAAAAAAGTRSVLVRTGNAGTDRRCDVQPTLVVDTLGEAVAAILRAKEQQ
jgi:D,D-heptose 1,7-bisphosphate phosphatase